MNLGDALKQLREELGLTQKDVAAAIGIKRTTYNSYENSKTVPKYDVMEKIAKFYELSLKNYSEEPKSHTLLTLNAPTVEYELPKPDKELSGLTSDEKLLIRYLRTLEGKKRADFLEEVKNEYLEFVLKNFENKE
ncbi:MAG: helix-turn-helix transcriptional regulator [Ruminococcaceae bacterium]|nr:helix-turn-helix transcriptional regulator [Oscillospiraceae bacterium]